MINSKNIVLTGFMGSGKTTVGKEIARKLNREFLDSDKIIEKEQNQTISDIFKKEGEAFFRNLERQLVTEICKNNNKIIATGGETLLDDGNFNLLSKTGIIFCLTANIDILIARLGDCRTRPLAAKKGKDEIKKLYESRKRGYAKLPNQIDTTDISPPETAKTIINLFDELSNNAGVVR